MRKKRVLILAKWKTGHLSAGRPALGVLPSRTNFNRHIPSNSVSMAMLPKLRRRWKGFPPQPSGQLDFRRAAVSRSPFDQFCR
jgi:hypothetical protein